MGARLRLDEEVVLAPTDGFNLPVCSSVSYPPIMPPSQGDSLVTNSTTDSQTAVIESRLG